MSLYAALDWQHNEPVSLTFEDVYFSRAEGLAEAQHVFIKHNRLPERFAALTAHDHFTIGELGFGTGLNFLCAWRCFLTHAPASARLHMVSIEKFPLHPADLKQALALWPELARESAALVQHYHTITAGWQRLVFAEGRITLTLAIGDVHDVLPQLDANVDAWFLDGFSPAKNPEMWQASLFHTLATLSSPGSTFATFTSAGEVRRALAASGFHVHKARGLGKKREISHGTLATPPSPPWQAPWFARPQANHDKSVLIIGGGLAGAATAYSLARRAWAVTLIERHPALAHEASGNPQGVVYAKLSAHAPPLTQWLLSGYGYTLRTLAQLFGEDDDYWQRCGVLQLAFNAQEQARQQQLTEAGLPTDLLYALTAEQTNALAGVAINQAALYFPQGAWVTPPSVCQPTQHAPRDPTVSIQCRMSAGLGRSATALGGLWRVRSARVSQQRSHCCRDRIDPF